ncbi:hypothetical protein V8C40DRAFT_9322 [Trichoderma camerunense]
MCQMLSALLTGSMALCQQICARSTHPSESIDAGKAATAVSLIRTYYDVDTSSRHLASLSLTQLDISRWLRL